MSTFRDKSSDLVAGVLAREFRSFLTTRVPNYFGVILTLMLLNQVTSNLLSVSVDGVSIALAQGADDDGDDDDDAGGDDDDPGGGGGGGGGDDAPVGELQGNVDDGDNAGPRDSDDCFEEVLLRPAWLRPCKVEKVRRDPSAEGVSKPVSPKARNTTRITNFGGQLGPAGQISQTEPRNALPRELIAVRLSAADIARLEARGFTVLSRSTGALAIGDLFRLAAPDGVPTLEARAVAQQLAPAAIIDFNHIFRAAQAACNSVACSQRRAIRWPQPPNECRIETTIGMIDTNIDPNAPGLQGQKIELINGVSGGRPATSARHGTAIAGLLVGRSDSEVPGLLPRSSLVAVQAFHAGANGEEIGDTYDIVTAIDTLVRRGIKVINLSLAGPNNLVLAESVRRSNADGTLLVAAAGNKGPTGPVVYPAGFESVVAVTAVGDDLRIYRGANRGAYIDFAAPGVNVQVVSAKVETTFESGTSFAAPFISAALAAAQASLPGSSNDALVSSLQQTASDLGVPGRDPIFGWGLVQVPEFCK